MHLRKFLAPYLSTYRLEILRCSPSWFGGKLFLRSDNYVEADPSQLNNFVLHFLNISLLSSMVRQATEDQAWHAKHGFDESSKRRQFENSRGPTPTFFLFSGVQSQILRFSFVEILTSTMSRIWGFEDCSLRGFLFLFIFRMWLGWGWQWVSRNSVLKNWNTELERGNST